MFEKWLLRGRLLVNFYSQQYYCEINAFIDICQVLLVFTSKMFEKHLWKSDILSKDAGGWQIKG